MSTEDLFIVAQPVEKSKILIARKIIGRGQSAPVYTESFKKSGGLFRKERCL